MFRPLLAATAILIAVTPAACAQTGLALAQSAPALSSEMQNGMYHPNSIQPETTLDVTAEASINSAPDCAQVSVGVQANAKTAAAAMASQAQSMNAMFDALAAAGIDRKDMQTSGLSLYPEYDYVQINEDGGITRNEQRLRGYIASNQLTVKVRKLDSLGATLDSLVAAGSNTVNGVTFALDNPAEVQDEARRQAMANAFKRAELYASAAGMRVGRIVTISESGAYSEPSPYAARLAQTVSSEAAPTPIAAGEVSYASNVAVRFELVK
jgi:uncharacterized protein